MSSSYRKTVEKLNEQTGDREPCRGCSVPTPLATLTQYGGRCRTCCEAFYAEGLHGGAKGYLTGAPDTAQQADMRRRLKSSTPAVNVLNATDAEVDAKARDEAKAATARRVAEYAKTKGHSLEPSPDHQSRADLAEQRARAIGGRP